VALGRKAGSEEGVNLVVGKRGSGKTMFAGWLAAQATLGGRPRDQAEV
jgi:predicted NACHT family NTPase